MLRYKYNSLFDVSHQLMEMSILDLTLYIYRNDISQMMGL